MTVGIEKPSIGQIIKRLEQDKRLVTPRQWEKLNYLCWMNSRNQKAEGDLSVLPLLKTARNILDKMEDDINSAEDGYYCPKEVKDYFSALNQFMGNWLKYKEEAVAYDQEMAYEAAIVQTMKEMSDKYGDDVFKFWEAALRVHLEKIT